jgi:CheY-like chemotaxis protein
MHSPDDISLPSDPILVVDDEKIFLSALQQTLQRAGYPAVAHSSPLAALAELEQRKFSVIISDQLMPELSGLELLAKARQIQTRSSPPSTKGRFSVSSSSRGCMRNSSPR